MKTKASNIVFLLYGIIQIVFLLGSFGAFVIAAWYRLKIENRAEILTYEAYLFLAISMVIVLLMVMTILGMKKQSLKLILIPSVIIAITFLSRLIEVGD